MTEQEQIKQLAKAVLELSDALNIKVSQDISRLAMGRNLKAPDPIKPNDVFHFRVRTVKAVQWHGEQILDWIDCPKWLEEEWAKGNVLVRTRTSLGGNGDRRTLQIIQKSMKIAFPSDWLVRLENGQIIACSDHVFRNFFFSEDRTGRTNVSF